MNVLDVSHRLAVLTSFWDFAWISPKWLRPAGQSRRRQLLALASSFSVIFCGCVVCEYISGRVVYINPEGYELSQWKSFFFLAAEPSRLDITDTCVRVFTHRGTCLNFFFRILLDKYYYSILHDKIIKVDVQIGFEWLRKYVRVFNELKSNNTKRLITLNARVRFSLFSFA